MSDTFFSPQLLSLIPSILDKLEKLSVGYQVLGCFKLRNTEESRERRRDERSRERERERGGRAKRKVIIEGKWKEKLVQLT